MSIDVRFKISSRTECPNIVKVNMSMRNVAQLKRYGPPPSPQLNHSYYASDMLMLAVASALTPS